MTSTRALALATFGGTTLVALLLPNLLQAPSAVSVGATIPVLGGVGLASWLAGPVMRRWMRRGHVYVRGGAVGAALVFGSLATVIVIVSTVVMWGSLHNWSKMVGLALWFGAPHGLWVGAVAGLLFAWAVSDR